MGRRVNGEIFRLGFQKILSRLIAAAYSQWPGLCLSQHPACAQRGWSSGHPLFSGLLLVDDDDDDDGSGVSKLLLLLLSFFTTTTRLIEREGRGGG